MCQCILTPEEFTKTWTTKAASVSRGLTHAAVFSLNPDWIKKFN